MVNNLDRLQAVNVDYFAFLADDKPVHAYLKSAAVMTGVAVATLSSAYLAYQNPRHWWLTTSCVALINLYVLPKILHFGNCVMIKTALALNLTSLGSLMLGGIGIATISLSKLSLTFLKTTQLSNALFTTFFLTGVLGYGLPLCKEVLEKVYYLLREDEWQSRMDELHDQFHRMPELGLGFLQSNLWHHFILNLTLLKPDLVLEVYRIFNIDPPSYVWPVVTAMSDEVSVNQFKNMISQMEQIAHLAELQGDLTSDEMKDTYYMRLKTALRAISKENLTEAVILLLSNGPKLIPYVLSSSQFLTLCIEDAQDAFNELSEQFLNLLSSWDDLRKRYLDLNQDIIQLEQDVKSQNLQKLTTNQKEDLLERHQIVAKEFNSLRGEIEKVYFDKRIWQNFIPLCLEDDQMKDLPDDFDWIFQIIWFNQPLLIEIDQTYRSLIETQSTSQKSPNPAAQTKLPTLSASLQYITSKLATIEEDDDDETVSAVMFLGANKEFVQKDYDNLQEWLDLDSPHQLEEAMEKLGLATEEDLYAKNILPRQGQISKTEISQNLRKYIDQMPKPHLAQRVQPKNQIQPASLLNKIIQTITRLLYYAISSSLILVPVLIHPHLGLRGIALGTSFFVLKRFNVPGTQAIVNGVQKIVDHLPLGNFFFGLVTRRIITLTPRRREQTNQFIHANFFERMRIINCQILLAIFISHFSLRADLPPVGSFFQGIALGGELVDIV